jgi:hypothetical protein
MRRKKCIFTKIKNGGLFFKIWYKYYSKFFDEKDIYVIDYGSTDGSLDGLLCNKISLNPDSYNAGGCSIYSSSKTINGYKAVLQQSHEYVMYTDFDEIVYHPSGLGNYIDQLQEDYVTCKGYEIVQNRRVNEGCLDFEKPVLSQRNYWFPRADYDKSLITRINITWDLGCHDLIHHKKNYAADLLLIHLHKIDYSLTYALNERNIEVIRDKQKKAGIDDPDSQYGIEGGFHNFCSHKVFDGWWAAAEDQLVLIPKNIKQSLIF